MIKKEYLSPQLNIYSNSIGMAVPLAFFSAATAAAAVVGTVAGAAAAAKVMGDKSIQPSMSSKVIKDLLI